MDLSASKTPVTLAKNVGYLALNLFKNDLEEFMNVKDDVFKMLMQAIV